jgi:ribosomal protein S18 acetylase RimI-like enzyme
MEITIREREERDIAGIAKVRIDTWRSAYRGIVPEAHLAGLSYAADEARFLQRFHDTHGDPGLHFFVAEDKMAGVVGFAAGGPEREGFPGYPGELYALYVLPQYQGLGIGQKLASAVFARLRAASLEPVLIWALKENRLAYGFYTHLGGVPVGEKTIEIGGKVLVEVGFGYGGEGKV